jgi:hypothetical protein
MAEKGVLRVLAKFELLKFEKVWKTKHKLSVTKIVVFEKSSFLSNSIPCLAVKSIYLPKFSLPFAIDMRG